MADTEGRSCPLAYRYRPEALCGEPSHASESVLYIVGGLYGNTFALDEIEAMAQADQHPDIQKKLSLLPRYRCLIFGGLKILVLHGDPESLAGLARPGLHVSPMPVAYNVNAWLSQFDRLWPEGLACGGVLSEPTGGWNQPWPRRRGFSFYSVINLSLANASIRSILEESSPGRSWWLVGGDLKYILWSI